MKVKTSELKDATLDWAVAKSAGVEFMFDLAPDGYYTFKPSSNWSIAGPIIERERISVRISFEDERKTWTSHIWGFSNGTHTTVFEHGDTPLEAAMRCYVSSKLGDEVELPEELEELK